MDYGAPISYMALDPGADVVSSDGHRVGRVAHVLFDLDADIFDGIVVDTGTDQGGAHFVDAPQVDQIYERAVVLNLSAAEAAQLPKPAPVPGEHAESALGQKLRRAWDAITGKD